MNREIKFRAWDKERKELGYFTLLQLQQGQASEIWTKFENWCEYTGLKDKNGKEIYEGDIVKSEQWNPSVYQVCFDRGAFYIAKKYKHEVADIKYVEEFEVIGSIYENPELL